MGGFAKLDGRFWRLLSVRWHREPLSGQGAAITGGRWNRRGLPALYLASDHGTAIAEYHQALVRPGTLVAFDVTSDKIVDLTEAATAARQGATSEVLLYDWRTAVAIDHREPPGWALADRLIADGAHGALVPSAQNAGGINLVLWRWSGDGAMVRVIDPAGDLARPVQSR